MKNYITILLAFTFAFAIYACKDDDDSNTTLPPATQTGAGTFACHVNGQSFIDTSGGWFNCYYQYVDGGYYFSVGGNDEGAFPQHIYIQTENKTISEGEVLFLSSFLDGNAYAGGGFVQSTGDSRLSYTNSEYTGELTITKLDFVHSIVSGTFWFDIENPYTGETVEIRDGRFDTLFTQ